MIFPPLAGLYSGKREGARGADPRYCCLLAFSAHESEHSASYFSPCKLPRKTRLSRAPFLLVNNNEIGVQKPRKPAGRTVRNDSYQTLTRGVGQRIDASRRGLGGTSLTFTRGRPSNQ